MQPIPQNEFDHICTDPSSSYRAPDDVLLDNRLTHAQKVAVLKLWAFDAREIEVAQEENMLGDASQLRQILLLLRQLEGK